MINNNPFTEVNTSVATIKTEITHNLDDSVSKSHSYVYALVERSAVYQDLVKHSKMYSTKRKLELFGEILKNEFVKKVKKYRVYR